jgi:hypothetical protein
MEYFPYSVCKSIIVKHGIPLLTDEFSVGRYGNQFAVLSLQGVPVVEGHLHKCLTWLQKELGEIPVFDAVSHAIDKHL